MPDDFPIRTDDATAALRAYMDPFLRDEWFLACLEIVRKSEHLTIDVTKLDPVIDAVLKAGDSHFWKNYVSPKALEEVDQEKNDVEKLKRLGRVAFEMAVVLSGLGGFVYHDPKTDLVTKWQLEGSGVKAWLRVVETIRTKGVFPKINDISPIDFPYRLGPIFADIPYGEKRLEIFKEIGSQRAWNYFNIHFFKDCRQEDGSFLFTYAHAKKLALLFPESFGEDAPFHKKASLFLLSMSSCLKEFGFKVRVNTIPPAEYRIPAIYVAVGAIKPGEKLERDLELETPLAEDSGEVMSLRAAAVVLTGAVLNHPRIKEAGLLLPDVDNRLYLLKPMAEGNKAALIATMRY